MTEAHEIDDRDARLERRAFLRRGGLVAGGAALGTAVAASGAGAQVNAQAIDYTYFPVDPARVYDSRSQGGFLNNGFERTLITNYQNLEPPPIAVTFNLTVTQTVGAGWLAIFPGDVAFNGTSNINWFGNNQDLANNAFVRIPLNGDANDGHLTVRCGGIPGAKAQFILDIMGASAGIDYSVTSASDARSAFSGLATTFTEG
jgi:hypothetical protein